jgi:hypothetical protein
MHTTSKILVILFLVGCSDPVTPGPTVMVDCQRTAEAEGVTIDCGNNGNENVTYYGDAPPPEEDPGDEPLKILWGQQCQKGGTCPEKECFISMCVEGQCASVALDNGQACLFSPGSCQAGVCQAITPD